jgi:putative transposase
MRVYPAKAQSALFSRLAGATRWFWNHALDTRTMAYRHDGSGVGLKALSQNLTALRAGRDTAWLGALPREPFNQVLRNQERAFANFFAQRAAYRAFKAKGHCRESLRFTIDQRRAEVMIERGSPDNRWAYVNLPGVGRLKLRRTEELVGRLRSITLSRNGAGQMFAAISADKIEAPAATMAQLQSVGIDAGLKTRLVVAGDGDTITSHHPCAATQERLRQIDRRRKRYMRHCARQVAAAARPAGLDPTKPLPKGTRLPVSNRQHRTRQHIAKLDARVAAIRNAGQHHATTAIVRSAQVIAIEDLNVAAMGKALRRGFRRSVYGAGMGEIRRQLTYKANWAGRTLMSVDRFYPSSKTCSACGQINGMLTLSDRRWTCATCNTEHDRDINAARNIRTEGLRLLGEQTGPDGRTAESGRNLRAGRGLRGGSTAAHRRSAAPPLGEPRTRRSPKRAKPATLADRISR